MARVIEALVFDLDGVLIDSEQVWDEGARILCRRERGKMARRRPDRHDGDEFEGMVPVYA